MEFCFEGSQLRSINVRVVFHEQQDADFWLFEF